MLNKIEKITDKKLDILYYIILLISLIISSLPRIYMIGIYSLSILGFLLVGLVIFLWTLLFIIVIIKIKKYGFIKGFKELSFNIYSLLIVFTISFFISKHYTKEENKMKIKVYNDTNLGVSNFEIFGRNNITKIDTIKPFSEEDIFFYGKNVKRDLVNDYENEIIIRYYQNNKWKEKHLLKGFTRWRVLNDSMIIKISTLKTKSS